MNMQAVAARVHFKCSYAVQLVSAHEGFLHPIPVPRDRTSRDDIWGGHCPQITVILMPKQGLTRK